MKLAVSGPPGSGKTTVSLLVAEVLNFTYVSGGSLFRDMAKAMNMDLEEFSKVAETNFEIDQNLDETLKKIIVEKDNVVIDSRLSGWIAQLNKVKCVKIYIDATFDKRVERIWNRELGDINKIAKNLKFREKSERTRYKEIYNIDFSDLTIYDMVINTDNMTATQAANKVVEFVKKHEHV